MSVFLISLKGQIETAAFPEYTELFIKYQFVYGEDWIVTTGIEEGITQICKRYDLTQDFNFNFPLDVTFKSTNPRGWPQLVLCAYGRDTWGQEVVRGYGASFVPLSLGRKTVGMFVPEASNVASQFSILLSGRAPELYDPRILTRNRGREVLRTTSKGCVHVVFNMISKDTHHLGYALASQERPSMIHLPLKEVPQDRLSVERNPPPERQSSVSNVDNQLQDLSPHDRGDMPTTEVSAVDRPPVRRPRHSDASSRDEARAFSPSSQPALSPRVTVVQR